MKDFCICATCTHSRQDAVHGTNCGLLAEAFEPGLVRFVGVHRDACCDDYAHDAQRLYEFHGIDVESLAGLGKSAFNDCRFNGVSPGADFPASLVPQIKASVHGE